MDNFNDLFDVKDLKSKLDAAEESSSQSPEFKDVPAGAYEVKLEKGDLVKSSTNKPMCKMQFRIIGGDYDKQCLFYNKVLVGVNKDTGELSAMPLHFNNEFLKSLKVFDDADIVFNDFVDYKNLILDVVEEANKRGLTFKLEYTKKGEFAEFKIKEVYDTPF